MPITHHCPICKKPPTTRCVKKGHAKVCPGCHRRYISIYRNLYRDCQERTNFQK